MTGLRVGRSGLGVPAGAGDFSLEFFRLQGWLSTYVSGLPIGLIFNVRCVTSRKTEELGHIAVGELRARFFGLSEVSRPAVGPGVIGQG